MRGLRAICESGAGPLAPTSAATGCGTGFKPTIDFSRVNYYDRYHVKSEGEAHISVAVIYMASVAHDLLSVVKLNINANWNENDRKSCDRNRFERIADKLTVGDLWSRKGAGSR